MNQSYDGGACVCLVVPCYNEERRLDIRSFRDFLANHKQAGILFVDDGSRDGTQKILEQVCAGLENQSAVLKSEQNRGKAEAVRTGVEYALQRFEPEIIGYWDADLATPLSTVDRFLRVFASNSDVLMVFGARVKLLGRRVERRAIRHYLGRVFATVVSMMLRLPIYDTQCGAKLFRVNDQLRAAFAQPFLSKWVFDVEILARYLRFFQKDRQVLEQTIYEYPLEQWIDVAGSKVHPADFLKAFLDILRIKRKYL
ncbi:MAG TPA: glycosyltransferase [Bryobacteraceae bacterium]|nr:glycosyltransferase [Bryobacteraceae bacterium]